MAGKQAAALVLLGLFLSSQSCRPLPASPAMSASYRQLPGAEGHVFLTFDAHPCGMRMRHKCDEAAAIAGAWELLDTLRAQGVHSTFFFTGEFIERYPAIARRVLEDGHEIGSHLKTHIHPLELESQGKHFSREWFQEELLSADKALVAATGRHTVKLFRMPYGLGTYAIVPGIRRILAWSHELGYTHVDWSVDTMDWVSRDLSRESFVPRYLSAQQMEDRIVSVSRAAPVVLSHLTRYRPHEEASVNEALPDLLARLRSMKITPARVSDFIPGAGRASTSEDTASSGDIASMEQQGGAGSTESVRQCNYVWNFKRLHLCVQGMRDDCSSLESSFLLIEDSCACTPSSSNYSVSNLGEIVQVTCSIP